ncbi:hypothetical protein LDENG_00108650 [Lucifuga dentata]|nr:hypothetical protein LDENG_00108650 [Lucifuga dentata]
MPRDISSSSSSGDEVDTSTTQAPETQKESEQKNSRYQCPADFVSFCHKPCNSTLTDSLKDNKELWLIKAPASFDPECFNGIKVPLSGLQVLKVPPAVGGAKNGSGQQIYSILASTHGTSELHLLTSHKQSSDGVVFGPAFSGLLNVCESYGDSSTNQAPHVIPATPAPSIPPGLKQHFHPFGSKTPTLTCVAESEVDGAAFRPSFTTLHPPVLKRLSEDTGQEDEEGRKKKKKKKKKEKHIKTEQMEEEEQVRMKEELMSEIPTQLELPFQDGEVSEENRKKKKKKKDKERQEMELAHEVKEEEVTVKCEPEDTSYGDIIHGKKKKKKKKSKTNDD